jgi:oleate hydratase
MGGGIGSMAAAAFLVRDDDPVFFEKMEAFSGNQPGTGRLVTFKDSRWLMSCYRISRTSPISRRMFKCFGVMRSIPTGLVILLANRCRSAPARRFCVSYAAILTSVSNQPSRRRSAFPHGCPTSRACSCHAPVAIARRRYPVVQELGVRQSVCRDSRRRGVQVEYSVRVAQMAVYELLGITREISPILRHDRSVKVQFDSILKAFR